MMKGVSHLLDVLERAALTDSGLIFLDNGIDGAPTRLSYSELLRQAKTNGQVLHRSGIVKQGEIAVMYFDSHCDNIIWYWSIIAAGGIAAIMSPISNEPKAAAGQLQNIKNLFSDSPLITSVKLAPNFASHDFNVKTVYDIQRLESNARDSPVDDVPTFSGPDSLATILFTSGSTGHSKAVQYTHSQLIASVRAKATHLDSKDRTFMSWISFDHSANFCESHLQSMYIKTDQIHVPTTELVVEPYRFFHVLSVYKVGYTFTPNFFLASAIRSFNEQPEKSSETWDLSNLRTIMCAGEANRTETLVAGDALLRRFGAPPHSIRAAYGLSETCSACFYHLSSPQYDLTHNNIFASAGKPLPSVLEMKILSQEDNHTQSSQGILYLRGEILFKGYYNNPSATEACMTPDGWFNTGDIARIDAEGNIHLLGRQKEILILHGNNYSSFELEHSLETSGIEGLTPSFTAVFSTWSQVKQSEAVVVLFNPSESATGPKKLKETLLAIDRVVLNFASETALRIIPLPKVLLPKSTIGKLSRAQLKASYEAGSFDDYFCDELLNPLPHPPPTSSSPESHLPITPLERELAEAYASILDVPSSSLLADDALLTSGINSMGFIKVKRTIESALKMDREIPMQILTRCGSVRELAEELTKMGTTSAEYDPIVPLVTKGSKPPIFLLPPGAGEFLCWFNLLEYLPDRPIFAVRARGLHGNEPVFEGLEEMLEIYSKAIRRTQKEGPYLFFGYCWGGLLAFELGKMFEREGLEVAFCGGLDNPPDLRRALGHVRYRAVLSDFLPALVGMTAEEAVKFTDETSGMEDPEFYEAIYERLPPAVVEENGGLTVQRIKAYGKVEDSHRKVAFGYVPEGRVKSYDVFIPDVLPLFDISGFNSWDGVMEQWRGYADSPGLHRVAGNHYTVLKHPDIVVFQEALNRALEARGV